MDWEILLQEVIGPTHVLYHSAHYGTLSLCVFLRRDLIWFSTGISSTINLNEKNTILLSFFRT